LNAKKPDLLIVFTSRSPHFWLSCQVIESHILAAFKYSDLPYEIFEIDKEINHHQVESLKELAQHSNLHFYFLSDVLRFQDLCLQIEKADLSRHRYYFPIFGNMTMEVYRWLELSNLLYKKDVFLLGASPRSCQQISRFVTGSIFHVPFCFQEEIFLPFTPTEGVNLIYAGRITPQKNVLELLMTFRKAKLLNPSLHLHIAGDFHERGFHLHGYKISMDKFVKDFKRLIQAEGITWHGNLSQFDLLKLLGKMDHFISMSTYHDEDFGMSACQSAYLGLGLILSDWGGHGSLRSQGTLIKVRVDEYSLPKIDQGDLLKTLVNLGPKNNSNPSLMKHFSYKVFIERLKKLMHQRPAPFEGLSELYKKYGTLAIKTYPFFNGTAEQEKRDFYLSIYESYLKDEKDQERFEII
jgi:glycosyltransferase involved in cell wall biosynthesis